MKQIVVAREFFEQHLPADFLQSMDMKTLQIDKNTFIDEAFKESEADVLYSVQTKLGLVYLYILCEHQSVADYWIMFRLLKYILHIMDAHMKQYPHDDLPFVYPMIVYTGKDPWNVPLEIFPLFGKSEELARELFLKPAQLLDIHRMSDDELRQHQLSGLVAFAFKHRKTTKMEYFLDKLYGWIMDIEGLSQEGEFIAKIVIRYVMNEIPEGYEAMLIQKSQDVSSKVVQGEVRTVAQKWHEDGRVIGVKQGVQQGEARLLIKLLKQRFGTLSAADISMIEQADEDTLLTWGTRILEVESLEEMFDE